MKTKLDNSNKNKDKDVHQKKHRKCGLDKAIEDIKAGRVRRFESAEELFKDLGI